MDESSVEPVNICFSKNDESIRLIQLVYKTGHEMLRFC